METSIKNISTSIFYFITLSFDIILATTLHCKIVQPERSVEMTSLKHGTIRMKHELSLGCNYMKNRITLVLV